MNIKAIDLEWKIVNDVVMGGNSNSEFEIKESNINFKGFTSLKNNGGFASIRGKLTMKLHETINLIKVNTQSDERNYEIILKSKENNYSYRHPLTEEFISLKDFNAYFRGTKIEEYKNITSNNIESIGIIIADGIEKEFTIEIKDILFK